MPACCSAFEKDHAEDRGYCCREPCPFGLEGTGGESDRGAWGEAKRATWEAERRAQVDVLREIFGNPFRPITLGTAWRTPTVTSLGEEIYLENAFDLLPILADALEDAGCNNREVLDHCRSGGEHVRGCWAVDL